MRVVPVMDDDFQLVATWALRSTVSWLDHGEVVILVLKINRKLYSPMTLFAKLKLMPGENVADFAKKLRTFFYCLPVPLQFSRAVGETFNDILEEHLPLSLLYLTDNFDKISAAAAMEELIKIIKIISQCNLSPEVSNKGHSSPVIVDPVFDKRTINVAKESCSRCFKGGKDCHWAPNCNSATKLSTPLAYYKPKWSTFKTKDKTPTYRNAEIKLK